MALSDLQSVVQFIFLGKGVCGGGGGAPLDLTSY